MTAKRVLLLVVLLLPTPTVAQSYADITAASGIQMPTSAPTLGRGGCSSDLDGDGDEDLILAAGPGQPLHYYRNDGGLNFTDLSASLPPLVVTFGKGIVAADIDNDGDQDVAIAQYGGPFLLLVNDGTGSFTEEAALRGASYVGAGWSPLFVDYDRDGWIDIFLGTYHDPVAGFPVANRLFRNVGNGWFTDVTGATGIEDAGGLFLAATWFDHDLDGWPDVVIANDKGTSPNFAAGTVYRNNRDGTFTDLGPSAQCYFMADGMGVDAVDLFNDGGWEIYVTDVPPSHVLLSQNPATGIYSDIGVALGIAGGPNLMGWGAHFIDADNDGWQDIHVVHMLWPNALYRNPGTSGAPWADVGVTAGCALADAQYSVIVSDFDSDGGLDLLNILPLTTGATLLRQVGPIGNWLKVKTEGTVSNRDGIGAMITVTASGVTQRQHVRSGRGYMTGSDRRCHFGLGTATQATRVHIRWPSGALQTFDNVAANQVLHVREPRVAPLAPPTAGTVTPVEVSFPGDAGLGYLLGLSLGSPQGIPLPDGRTIPLTVDPVLLYVLAPNPVLWPTVGVLSSPGATASVPFYLPHGAQGISLTLAAVSADPLAPYGARGISAPHTFQIQ